MPTGDEVSEPGFSLPLSLSSQGNKCKCNDARDVPGIADASGTEGECLLLGPVVPSNSSDHSFLKRNVKLLMLSREQMLC